MPKFLENKLKAEYGADSAVPYKVLNNLGAMKGSQETAKGKSMQKKHESKLSAKQAAKIRKQADAILG